LDFISDFVGWGVLAEEFHQDLFFFLGELSHLKAIFQNAIRLCYLYINHPARFIILVLSKVGLKEVPQIPRQTVLVEAFWEITDF